MATFLSPAFLQQCFAMHRYDLVVKRLTQAGVVVTCRQCKLRHTARIGPWEAESADRRDPAAEALVSCAGEHVTALQVQTVDVQHDHLEVGCRQCRTASPFRILECVTRSIQTSGEAP